jgi:hypothetical protein
LKIGYGSLINQKSIKVFYLFVRWVYKHFVNYIQQSTSFSVSYFLN